MKYYILQLKFTLINKNTSTKKSESCIFNTIEFEAVDNRNLQLLSRFVRQTLKGEKYG